MVDGYLNFDTRVDTSGFNKGAAAITKQSSKIGGVFKTALGTALGFGIEQLAQRAISGLISIATQAIDLASDLTEVQNVVDVSFGDMAYKCEAFAETAVEQFGMSKLTAKQTASTYMAMAKSIGLSMDNASDMAISLAGLAGDVASFYNIGTDEAATKLKSVFTGETETLKEIGVMMTETNLKQYALTQGITKSYSEMSQAEKTALRYNFVMNTLADAQGDFARTSNSWANQTRVLSERWKELLGILGSGLIVALTPVVKMLNRILSTLINITNALAKSIGKFFGITATVKETAASTGTAAAEQEALTDAANGTADATKKAAKEAKKATANFDELNILSQNTSSSSGDSSGASAGNGSDLLSFEDEGSEGGKDVQVLIDKFGILEQTINRIKDSWNKWFGSLPTLDITIDPNAIKKALSDIAAYIADTILGWGSFIVTIAINIANDLDLGLMGQRFLELMAAVAQLASALTGVLVPAFEAIYDTVISPVLTVVGGTINQIILPLLTDTITALAGFIEEHGTAISAIVTGIGTAFMGLKVISVISGLITGFSAILPAFILGITGAQGALQAGKLAMIAYNVGAKLAAAGQAALNLVMSANPIALVVVAILGLVAAFKYAWENSEAFREFWITLWEKIKEVVSSAWEKIKEFFTSAYEKIKSVFDSIATAFTTIKDKITTAVNTLKSTITSVWNSIKTHTTTTFNSIKKFITDTFIAKWNAAWKGLATKFVNIWNTIVGIVESGVNLIIKAVNWCIKQINKIQIDVPDWVEKLTGMSTFGFNIPTINTVKLSRLSAPKLASGAVIPPNGEFMAILGDQKHGNNIETPEALLRQIFREEIGSQNVTVVIEGDTSKIFKVVQSKAKEFAYRTGKPAFD